MAFAPPDLSDHEVHRSPVRTKYFLMPAGAFAFSFFLFLFLLRWWKLLPHWDLPRHDGPSAQCTTSFAGRGNTDRRDAPGHIPGMRARRSRNARAARGRMELDY
ncbi:hypothetical protein GY45DRAFT_1376457 [Cubamyces sp. BRFM 1775]|nr:hypothetical protein GY45DRAFT_1376457 [Cubamyces sp. BRFM 1775]